MNGFSLRALINGVRTEGLIFSTVRSIPVCQDQQVRAKLFSDPKGVRLPKLNLGVATPF